MTDPKRFCVVGYASIDHKYLAAPFEGAGRTTMVREPVNAGGPEPGAVSYFARAIARHSARVDVVSWVAADSLGDVFCDSLADAHVDVEAVSRRGERSPTSHMFYPADGEAITFFDPGELDQSLTPLQRRMVADADVVVATVSPHDALADALDAIHDDAVLMWAVKGDRASMSPALAARLAERAQIITYSANEAEFLRAHCGLEPTSMARARSLVVETRGADGVAYYVGGNSYTTAPGRAVAVRDQTGAGDTFAGSLLVRFVQAGACPPDLDAVISDACNDAAQFLAGRE